LRALAEMVDKHRQPTGMDNPFRRSEALLAEITEQWFDLARDVRDAWCELAFFGIYGTPFMRSVGQTHAFQRVHTDKDQLRFLPEVRAVLASITRGGLPEAVVRMLILLADARGSVRSSRLARSAYTLNHAEPFASLAHERRARLIPEQTLIVLSDREAAITTLVQLLPEMEARADAIGTVEYIAGPVEEMEEHTIELLQRMRHVLELPPLHVPKDQPEASTAEPQLVPHVAEVA
jgi:hypothetical protein